MDRNVTRRCVSFCIILTLEPYEHISVTTLRFGGGSKNWHVFWLARLIILITEYKYAKALKSASTVVSVFLLLWPFFVLVLGWHWVLNTHWVLKLH